VVDLVSDAASTDSAWDRRGWLVLGVIGLAQLMVVLDLTVMNIALPSAQRALHFTTVDRQWVVTAYTLAFGSLLLLGGRLADLLGRKVTFLTGLIGFAGVSAFGGASVSGSWIAQWCRLRTASVSDRARSRASGLTPASGYPRQLTSLASDSANSASPAAARSAARSG
jgi:MFS family permease